jgi:hypothetical protein
VGNFDNMLQFSGLFFNFGRQEKSRRGDRIPVEPGERVKHVEALHIDDRRIDA